jgi:hypothetical protein
MKQQIVIDLRNDMEAIVIEGKLVLDVEIQGEEIDITVILNDMAQYMMRQNVSNKFVDDFCVRTQKLLGIMLAEEILKGRVIASHYK